MDINSSTNSSKLTQMSSQIESKNVTQEISADQIRNIRETFEKESQYLEESIGGDAHRTMLMAMYEGTESLLNKKVSQYDLVEYLESLKVNAEELSNQGLSQQEFRSAIIRQSQNSVISMIKNI